jgi:hypothetical protein
VDALEILRQADTGPWRDGYLPRLAASDVTVGWGPLPAGVNGEFNHRTRRITVADRHRSEPAHVIAPVLAHELVHALDQDGIGTPADCLNDEVGAFENQALAWAFVAQKGPDVRLTSPLARHHGEVADAWIRHGLGEAVLTTPGYQLECLGGTVRTG